MHPSLEPFVERVNKGLLRTDTLDDLVLFNYTNQCVFDKAWDEYTMQARGLIMDSITGEVVGQCFKKFFNGGMESEESQWDNLPNLPFIVTEKIDGSYIQTFRHRGELRCSSRGSFASPQAIDATKILQTRYKMLGRLDPRYTCIFEYISPQNRLSAGARLVVNYGQRRDIILLAVMDRSNNTELSRPAVEELANYFGLELVRKYDYTIDHVRELCKTLPAQHEGFVLRFDNGLRIKCKTEAYVAMHKLINQLTPKYLLEHLTPDGLTVDFYHDIPDDVIGEVRKMEGELMVKYATVYREVMIEAMAVQEYLGIKFGGNHFNAESRKALGLFIQKEIIKLRHKAALFPLLLGKDIHGYIKSCIDVKQGAQEE